MLYSIRHNIENITQTGNSKIMEIKKNILNRNLKSSDIPSNLRPINLLIPVYMFYSGTLASKLISSRENGSFLVYYGYTEIYVCILSQEKENVPIIIIYLYMVSLFHRY